MPFVTTVTLKGIWSRSDTSPQDLTDVRKATYRQNQRWWKEANDQGRSNFQSLTFLARQGIQGPRKVQTREGTFEATLEVPTTFYQWVPERTAISRAKTLLKWWLQDVCCRGPQLTIESAVVRRHYYGRVVR